MKWLVVLLVALSLLGSQIACKFGDAMGIAHTIECAADPSAEGCE